VFLPFSFKETHDLGCLVLQNLSYRAFEFKLRNENSTSASIGGFSSGCGKVCFYTILQSCCSPLLLAGVDLFFYVITI
jgi:hypothetical protein